MCRNVAVGNSDSKKAWKTKKKVFDISDTLLDNVTELADLLRSLPFLATGFASSIVKNSLI
jgi:hypothetical protein